MRPRHQSSDIELLDPLLQLHRRRSERPPSYHHNLFRPYRLRHRLDEHHQAKKTLRFPLFLHYRRRVLRLPRAAEGRTILGTRRRLYLVSLIMLRRLSSPPSRLVFSTSPHSVGPFTNSRHRRANLFWVAHICHPAPSQRRYVLRDCAPAAAFKYTRNQSNTRRSSYCTTNLSRNAVLGPLL